MTLVAFHRFRSCSSLSSPGVHARAWSSRRRAKRSCIRIYTNVVQLLDSPDERVLVIFGAGHLGWLRHNFASDPTVRLRKLAEVAGERGPR